MEVVSLLLVICGIAAALAPLTLSVVEMLKMAIKGLHPPGIPAELVPGLACLVGVILALLILGGRSDSDYRTIAIGGFVAGLIASKLFDAGQARAGPPEPTPRARRDDCPMAPGP